MVGKWGPEPQTSTVGCEPTLYNPLSSLAAQFFRGRPVPHAGLSCPPIKWAPLHATQNALAYNKAAARGPPERAALPEDGVTKLIFPDPEALIEGAAAYIADQLTQAIAERGRANIALSGGNTPKRIHERLAVPPHRERIDWSRVHVYFGDERCVPPDDPESTYRMARLTLLDRVPLPPGNIHRIRGEEEPARAAELYGAELESAFGGSPAAGTPTST